MHGWLGRRALRLVLVAGALLAGAAGAGYATNALTAPATTVIEACRNSENGQLRMLASAPLPSQHGEEARWATRCRPNEQAVSWNVQGLKGDQGPVGPQGPKGEPGAALTTVDALNGTDCSLTVPGATGPIPGKVVVTWGPVTGNSLATLSSTGTFVCKAYVPPPPCPSVPNGTSTCAANDGVVTSVACASGYFLPVGRDLASGCAPNGRTNATWSTAIGLTVVPGAGCAASTTPVSGAIAGPGDEAWYVAALVVSSGCPSSGTVTWTGGSGVAYDVYVGSAPGTAPALATGNVTGTYTATFPPFPGSVTLYLYVRVHNAPGATGPGTFTALTLQAA